VAAQRELACEANRLMHELGCPFSGQPELKGAAVRLEALGSRSRWGLSAQTVRGRSYLLLGNAMRAIFMSYRREDAEGQAGRLYADLVDFFGEDKVFMDVVDIEPGRDFRQAIDEQVASCGVLLALIGRDWLDLKDKTGRRRLEDPMDFVRLETASALKRDIPVIPILVRGASLPQAEQLPADLTDLIYRNAIELSHSRWDSDVQVLIKALRPYVDHPEDASQAHVGMPSGRSLGEQGLMEPGRLPGRLWGGLGWRLSILAVSVFAFALFALTSRRLTGPAGETGPSVPADSSGQSASFPCRPFLAIGHVMRWQIWNKAQVVNAGTLQVISVSEAAREWEVEQITETKANKKVFLRGTFSATKVALNRGDAEKWIGTCEADRIVGTVKTTYTSDMPFEIR